MNYLQVRKDCSLESIQPSSGNILTDVLSSIPYAIASPILAYQRTREQARLAELAIKAKEIERIEILRTLQILSKNNALTPEISNALLSAYYNAPIPYLS